MENLLSIHWWHWPAFLGLVIVLLLADLVVFHRHSERPSLRQAAWWSFVWIALALIFNAFVWWWGWYQHGTSEAGVKFLTGYVVEKSLSVDNLFVFAVIFQYFGIDLRYQYRVLFWGVLGAIVMRGLFVFAGVELIRMFDWVMVVFGLFLVYTAVKLAFSDDEQVEPEKNFMLRIARRYFRITDRLHGERFFVRLDGLWYATPLLLVLLVIESSDVLFAVDSVPAVLGVSRDPFIVYSSNIFAILGLRALYFLLAGMLDRFEYLQFGLSAVLGFIGVKMVGEYAAEKWFGHHGHLIGPWWSLAIVGGILTLSVLPAFWKRGGPADSLSERNGEP
ncbi:TerC family protein [Thermostilla marina]